MPSLTDLHRAVESVLATQRIGQPVFVRYMLFGGAPSEGMASRLASMAALIRSWLGQPIQRIAVIATPDADVPSLTLQFAAGATAIASLAVGDPSVDLTILGNHGAIYHQNSLDALEGLPPAEIDLTNQIDRALALKEGAP